MNYKSIALIAILLPVTVMSYCKSAEARIKELKDAQFKKELELSDLGEIITKKDQILNSFDDDSQYLLRLLINRKKAKIEEKNDGKKLSKEEEKQLAEELRNSVNEFLHVFGAAYKEHRNVADMITNGMFHEDDIKGLKELESLKFFLIKSAFERSLIMKFIDKYKICLQELIKINQELANLEK